jgi:branched-chain amino acid transport system substrate-binding protein
MNRSSFLITLAMIASLALTACSGLSAQTYSCTDRLGCIKVAPDEGIKIAVELTLSGPDSPYGIDALRGVEIAITDKGSLLGHDIELVKGDDLCNEKGGAEAATLLAADPQIAGVIGTTCSSASVPASRILSGVGMVLISPSSTAPSLTSPDSHEAGFLRTIYNDKAQGKAVAEFAFNILGLRKMITIHDGTAYPEQLQAAACESFTQLGGECIKQIEITSGQDVTAVLQGAALENPDVLYYPVYAVDGANITNAVAQAGLSGVALMSSDGLLSTDFIQQTQPVSEGMYLSGPADVKESQPFLDKYKARYGENPIASYHLQAYDATMMLFDAIEKVVVNSGGALYIPRQALRDALYATHGLKGLSGTYNCSSTGDCAEPNIEIFQISGDEFKPIFP